MKISLRQLEVFVQVASLEHMSQAAEILHLSQSACSMAVAALEQQLAGPLFERHGRRLVLNERGRSLLPKAMHIISQVAELQQSYAMTRADTLVGHLIVGASTTIGNYLLPELLGQFASAHPHIKLSLQIANTETIIQQVANFKVDIGFIEGGCYVSQLNTIPWQTDELLIIAAPFHPLSGQEAVTWQDLYQAAWILREAGSGTRQIFEQAIGGKVEPYLELGHTEAIKQAVQAGLGISCLSKFAVKESLATGKLVALTPPDLILKRNLYLIQHQEKQPTAVIQYFLQHCLAYQAINEC